MIESPCIRVCTLDATGDLCLGCFRTLEEIGGWTSFSDAERFDVLERLPGRKLAHDASRAATVSYGQPVRCERCGAGFACGALDTTRPCWCTKLPPVVPTAARCLCPSCLGAATT